MTRFLGALVVLAALTLSSEAAAYPWMLRHGFAQCSTCHTDPSGGELLNEFGRLEGDTLLAFQWRSDASAGRELGGQGPARFGPLWNLVITPAWLALGGSARYAVLGKVDPGSVRHFPMQLDVYGQLHVGRFVAGGSLGAARVPVGSPHAREAQLTTEQGDGWNLISRWHFVGWELGSSLLLRAGRLNLPFGLRIPEHTAWVRQATRTDRESDQQHGVALAIDGASVRGELMAVLGNYQYGPDEYRERGYALYVEGLLTPTLALGGSSLMTIAAADRSSYRHERTMRQAHGLFGRWAIAEWAVLLAEADVLGQSRRDFGVAGFVQTDLMPTQGLHLLLTGELVDAGYELRSETDRSELARAPGAGELAVGGWLGAQWFFFRQLDLRVDAIFRTQQSPQILGQLHVYF